MAKVALLSNVTMNMLGQQLHKQGHEVYIPEGFDTWIAEVLKEDSLLFSQTMDAVVVLLHGNAEAEKWKCYEDGVTGQEQWRTIIEALADKMAPIPVFVSDLDISQTRILPLCERRPEPAWEYNWYKSLNDLCNDRKNLYVFPLKEIIARLGKKEFYSAKMWYMGSMPFSLKGIQLLTQELNYILQALKGPKKKCIALDLDNTLWGGVAGEDGINGISLDDHKEGAVYYDFQKRLKEIKDCGMLLTILSKNNQKDAEIILEQHEKMVLKNQDFAGRKINWETKPENLLQMAQELNLGVDAFVFADDNPAEREQMKLRLPMVETPEFPKDVTKLGEFAEEIYKTYFYTLRTTEEDKVKTELYRQEAERKQLLEKVTSLSDYIKQLEMEADIHCMRQDEAERVVQLCNKTNQFNVTTKRYSLDDVARLNASPEYKIYVAKTKDKYGEHGLVAVMILHLLKEQATVEVDSFLMSCRVMGRFLEYVMYEEIINACSNRYKHITACYRRTAKNAPVEQLFDKLGLSLTEETEDEKRYIGTVPVDVKKYNYKQITMETQEGA